MVKHRHSNSQSQLLADLLSYLARTVEMSDDDRRMVAVYIFLAHLAPLEVFPSVPYLNVRGPSGSGKSTLGRAVKGLTGGTRSSDLTPAVLFRKLNARFGRLCVLDEGERVIQGAQRDMFVQMFLEGNVIDGTVERMSRVPQGKDDRANVYRIFGPKCLVSIEGIAVAQVALSRRAIPITMRTASLRFESRKSWKIEKDLRIRLRQWAKDHEDEVLATYRRHRKGLDFANQAHRDLWAPMRAVADELGINITTRCRQHGKILKTHMEKAKRASVTLEAALTKLLGKLPSGQYHCKRLRKRLRKRYGKWARPWSPEKIGHKLRGMGYGKQMGRDGDGSYLEWTR